MKLSRLTRHAVLAVAVTALVGVALNPIGAIATHEPADKMAAAGSDLKQVDDATPILSETMRVSSTSDLILQTTVECSILTRLVTGEGATAQNDSAFAFGSVKLWIEVDGKRVPVGQGDAIAPDADDPGTDENDEGEATFCNRAYDRTVDDSENGDGVDTEDDYIRTRTANAFNWVAFDAGKAYDVGNDNIVTVRLMADFDERPSSCGADGQADGTELSGLAANADCADAFVGSRTLIVEPTHASNHEEALAQGGAGN